MRKAILVLSFLFVTGFSTQAFAEDYTWGDKLIRGVTNVVTWPVEIARQIQITSQDKSLAEGWTVGLVKGIGLTFMRIGVGLVDIVTFPFDFPGEGKAPLIEPEYVWQKPGVKYTSS